MKISVILGHPDKKSFNHAIAGVVMKTLRDNNHDVVFHDLYEEKFPPVLSSQEIPKDVSVPESGMLLPLILYVRLSQDHSSTRG